MHVSKTKKIIFKKEKQQRKVIVTRRNILTIKIILNLIKSCLNFNKIKKNIIFIALIYNITLL